LWHRTARPVYRDGPEASVRGVMMKEMAGGPAPERSIGAAALSFVRGETAKTAALKAAVLATEDPEAVHDLRVTIRRIRTAIRVLGSFLRPEVTALDEPLHGLFLELGHVRDLDIALDAWGDDESAAHLEVLERIVAIQATARLHLTVCLVKDSPLDALKLTLRKSPPSAGSAPCLEAAPVVLREAYDATRSAAKRLSKASPAEDIHRLRRRIKRLRYAVEFFAADYGKPAEKLAKQLRKLQDLLGLNQDALLVARVLRELPDLGPDARALAEAAAVRFEARAVKLRGKILDAAEDFGGDTWDRLKRRMKQ